MRQFGLIGFPLGHSWSQTYFTEKFSLANIRDCSYALFPMKDISGLPGLIHQHPNLCGLNVTIPHKEKVMPYLDSLSEEASAIGAVNTIKIDRQHEEVILTGYNTDAFGFERSLHQHGIVSAGRALVLGSGGAAKAVCYVLLKAGWTITMASRKPDTGDKPARQGGRSKGQDDMARAEVIPVGYHDIDDVVIRQQQLIINTTPLGMYPDTSGLPELPYEALTKDHVLYDLVYNPAMTTFLRKGLEAGCQVIGGIDMLKMQADRAWEIWTTSSPAHQYPTGPSHS